MYSETLLDHIAHPRNLREMEEANGRGTVGDPDCGDFLTIYLKVQEMSIRDISFQCAGCHAAFASGSVATELVKGKSLQEAVQLLPEHIVQNLGGMPDTKIHCAILPVQALRVAIADYLGISRPPCTEQATVSEDSK